MSENKVSTEIVKRATQAYHDFADESEKGDDAEDLIRAALEAVWPESVENRLERVIPELTLTAAQVFKLRRGMVSHEYAMAHQEAHDGIL